MARDKNGPIDVAFDLGCLIRDRESGEALTAERLGMRQIASAPGAVDSLARIRRLGGRSVAITPLTRHDAVRALGTNTVQLDVNELYCNITQPAEIAAELGRNALWAYVTETPSHISAVESTGTMTIGIAVDTARRQGLRQAGADRLLNDLTQLSHTYCYPGPVMMPNMVSAKEAGKLLGMDHFGRIATWRKNGKLLAIEDAFGQYRFPRDYIARLAALREARGEILTDDHAMLWGLQWIIDNGSLQERGKALHALDNLKDENILLGIKQVLTILCYTRKNILDWAALDFLPAIQVNRKYLWLLNDVHRVQRIMGGLTSRQVAQRIGVAGSTVKRLTIEGHLKAHKTPAGHRFDTEHVNRYAKRHTSIQDNAWTEPEVAAALEVSPETVRNWGRMGILPFDVYRNVRRYDPASVVALMDQRKKVHPDFEWIPEEELVNVYTPKRAASYLGVTKSTVHYWIQKGLLPFSNCGPKELNYKDPSLPIRYIQALVLYAGQTPVGYTAAKEFKHLCSEAQHIVRGKDRKLP